MAAQAIATRFGLDWSLADATARSTGYELENVRLHTWLLEGVTSAWGSFVRPAFAPTVVVSGVAGEVLRWGPIASSARNAASADDVIAGLRKASKFDPLGVLKPDAHAYYQGWIEDWVREQVERGIPFRSISAVRQTRIGDAQPQWTGLTLESTPPPESLYRAILHAFQSLAPDRTAAGLPVSYGSATRWQYRAQQNATR